MDNIRIVIKPKGLTLLAVIVGAVTLGIVALLMRPRPTENTPPVTVGGPAKNTEPEKKEDFTVIADENERAEKDLLRDLNKTPAQERDWLFLGPLASGSQITTKENEQPAQEQMNRIINTVYLPDEAKYQAKEGASFNLYGKTYAWKKHKGSAFDFKEMFKTSELPYGKMQNMVVYGVTHIESEKAVDKVINFRSDDGAIVWLNGDQVYKSTAIRGVRIEDKIKVKLRRGTNVLLVKVGQGDGGWGLSVHLVDAEGS